MIKIIKNFKIFFQKFKSYFNSNIYSVTDKVILNDKFFIGSNYSKYIEGHKIFYK